MPQFSEQRTENRLQIDGAQIKYRKIDEHDIGGTLFGPLPLKNLSCSGASFHIKHHLKKGDFVLVDIQVPDKDNIHALGVIQWTEYDLEQQAASAGIHFNQFGWGEPWNFIPYEARLHRLVKQHTKH